MSQLGEPCQAKKPLPGGVPVATDESGGWRGATQDGPGGTAPFDELMLGGYAATTRCRENGNGYPAGGLCACADQSPRWVRIFTYTTA